MGCVQDDMSSIRFGLEECDPDFLNLNMLRFMPGSVAADVPSHPAYSCVRPTGEKPITHILHQEKLMLF